MEFLQSALQNHFVWGLLLGLLVAGFSLKSGFTARRHAARELKRVETELRELQGHLNTQLKINASGNETINTELESLRRQNENLRVNIAALQQKPGRAEQRLLQIHEAAIRTLREQAPGFAAAWEKAFRQAEADLEAADSGFKKLIRRVLPSLGNAPPSPAQSVSVASEDHE
ncbi:MAG: hypothetical protein WCO57_15440 [Verrucomicrobiota bacterium]